MSSLAGVVVAVAVLSACKGDSTHKGRGEPTPAPGSGSVVPAAAAFELPSIDNRQLFRSNADLPWAAAAFVVIGSDGTLELANADPSWAGGLPAPRTPVTSELLRRRVLEVVVAGGGEAAVHAQLALDELNPPTRGDAGAGSGDAPGRDTIKTTTTDPQLARQQAIERARAAGILGAVELPQGAPFASLDGDGSRDDEPRAFGQLATAKPDALGTAALAPAAIPLVLAAATAPAIELVRVLKTTGGVLGVRRGSASGVLDLAYARTDESDLSWERARGERPWIEIHLEAGGLTVLGLPAGSLHAVPWQAGAVDVGALRAAHAGLRQDATFLEAEPAVDVLVGAGVPAQRLVDVVVALHDLGATRVSIGEQRRSPAERALEIASAPRPAPALFGRGQPSISIGSPAEAGGVDRDAIRATIRQSLAKIQYCYEKELLASPTLAGKVTVTFFISPGGEVASAEAAGINEQVASCIVGVIKRLKFPAPTVGRGVTVRYPFVFRTAE
ncbi:MAG: AgmX/PglI C-terminal domain-containing protein [Myxococcota bacterium]|nr:AgmX/PglI C-terminal domain-containing protein [Myxococcota bacterium]